jgi:hypothetical protein
MQKVAPLDKGIGFETESLKIVSQKNTCAKRYFQLTIVEMEMQQVAESIVRITKRLNKRRIN